ncbi:MAG: hypothetical protein F6J87_22660 [Spirulina sp. SIO3F2]|nr:hypothetical protein [Spirulina sp. SIO3F2]
MCLDKHPDEPCTCCPEIILIESSSWEVIEESESENLAVELTTSQEQELAEWLQTIQQVSVPVRAKPQTVPVAVRG